MSIHNLFGDKRHRTHGIILAFSWIVGLFLGCLVGSVSNECLSRTVALTASNSRLLAVLFARLSVPVVVAFLAFVSKEKWIYFICFLRMFVFGHSVLLLRAAFGSASWLVVSVFMLPSALLLVPTFWFCLRRVTFGMTSFMKDAVCVLTVVIGVSVFDFFVIAPFLGTVIA